MNANEWPVPDTQKAMFTMLKDGATRVSCLGLNLPCTQRVGLPGLFHCAGLSQLESALQTAEASLDTDTRKFAADVEQRVTRLKRDVISLRERLDVPMLGNPDSDITEVTRYMDKQTSTMKSIKEEVGMFVVAPMVDAPIEARC